MNSRSVNLKRIRPEIPSAKINDNMSSDERFQNMVLRPVIKFQNDLLVSVFVNYIKKHKGVFYDFALEKKMDYIENAIQKDMKLRNAMKGMIIGLFTVEDYLVYIENSLALNKRMMNLVKERLLSQIQLFDKPNFIAAV